MKQCRHPPTTFLIILVLLQLAGLPLRAAADCNTNAPPLSTAGMSLRVMGNAIVETWRASWRAAAADTPVGVTEDGNAATRGVSGEINEKIVSGARKSTTLAPLLHASFGLDHYPNYLQRWELSGIEELEQRLEDQLAKVRAQKTLVLNRIEAAQGFNSTIPAPTPETLPQHLAAIFDHRFLATLDPATGAPRPSLLGKLLTEECDGVFSFPLFKAEFCSRLVDCGENFVEYILENDLGHLVGKDRPKMLDLMDLRWLNDLLLQLVMNPISRLTMSHDLQGDELDFRHGYLVGYGPQQKQPQQQQQRHARDHLVAHSDDSEATLNVALATDYDGGELIFYGERGSGQEASALVSYRHLDRGHAVLHRGRQLHEVLPVTRGDRHGLIVWARSIAGVRQGICPCCWMNGRDAVDSACICGPRWN